MAGRKKWSDLKSKRLSKTRIAEIREEVREEVLEMNLTAIRELTGKTQEEVATAIGTTQSQVSRTESRHNHTVATLRQYVKAMGGEVEIVAHIGNKSVRLIGV